MWIKSNIVSLAFMLAALTISAQQKITITFIDAESGAPLKDVMIRGANETSDRNGTMAVDAVPGDTVEVHAVRYPLTTVVIGSEKHMFVKLSETPNENAVYTVVDKTAQFPGGMGKFYEWLASNMVYPPDAKALRVEGKVFVQFIIGRDGAIDTTSVRVIASHHPSLSAETIRVIQNSPAWISGETKGQKVRQQMVLPVMFNLGK